ncbi:flagellar biosynthesis anti-sigma factor FlgM [Pseudalkalibacillus caeni]|uniref:flagellar biosynthesis anti-sigma factor FlgM n=1 Tax=Exobacillus caeni TaxID=2574798 RepID=UPI001485A8F6|nr:flagellar biosynthesis anti-sigma factor FlgM [Pseudalkalibacillus caeni]
MNVNKPSGPPYINPYQKHKPVEKVQKSKSVSKQDELQISNKAKEMYENKAETEHEDRIRKIKEQVENGTYEIDSKKIAEKLYRFWF